MTASAAQHHDVRDRTLEAISRKSTLMDADAVEELENCHHHYRQVKEAARPTSLVGLTSFKAAANFRRQQQAVKLRCERLTLDQDPELKPISGRCGRRRKGRQGSWLRCKLWVYTDSSSYGQLGYSDQLAVLKSSLPRDLCLLQTVRRKTIASVGTDTGS